MKPLRLVKYGHEQCPPCRALKPVLDQIAHEYSELLEFVDVDTTKMSIEDLTTMKLRAVPLMILYKHNLEVWRNTGFMDKVSLQEVIKSHIMQWM